MRKKARDTFPDDAKVPACFPRMPSILAHMGSLAAIDAYLERRGAHRQADPAWMVDEARDSAEPVPLALYTLEQLNAMLDVHLGRQEVVA
ncbi:MAG: hypothetical protein ACQEXG_14895 [Pseudomonadota bacterium]